MNKFITFAMFALAVAGLVACGGRQLAPAGPETRGVPGPSQRRAAAVPTPYPLPRQTPNWHVVEAPKPWDFASAPPDRSGCAKNEGLIYRVGPGQAYPNPRDVPWLRLLPCDTVLVYPRAKPYDDVVYIASRGRVHKAITFSGAIDPKTGLRPVFDGSHAITSPNEAVDKYLLCAGMIIVGIPDSSQIDYTWGYTPGYLIIKNLEVRNAFGKYPGSNQPVYTCTDTTGKRHPWPEFTAGIYFNPAQHVLLENTYLHGNGLGTFVNSLDGWRQQSRDFTVKDNVIENNGNGEASQHNLYYEVVGERIVHNYFGPPIKNTQGENIKDRSVCVEYSDNYVDSGNNLIAFRDPQSNGAYEWHQKDAFGDPCVGEIYVHGNTFVSRGPTEFQAMSVVNAFGDGVVESAPQNNRYGALYFYNNVVVAIADKDNYGLSAVPIFQNGNQLKDSTFYGINNLFYSAPRSRGSKAPPFAACYWQRYVDFTSNWSNLRMQIKYAKTTDGNDAVGTPCDGSGMTGITVSKANPGFVNFAGSDFHLLPSSPFYTLRAGLPDAVTKRRLLPDGVQYPSPSP
jgi:hypothetical protein